MSRLGVHQEAKDLAEKALRLALAGDDVEARRLYARSAQMERSLAETVSPDHRVTFAVFHRSAASLAFSAGDNREAIRLASAGLANDPPVEIAADLRALLKKAQDASPE